MRANVVLWVVAVVLTLVFGWWQRVSGPTYPLSGSTVLGTETLHWRLERTHAGAGDHEVVVKVAAPDAAGTLEWREHAPAGPWNSVPMTRRGDALAGALPHHGPAQKVDYRVRLAAGGSTATLPAGAATLRFRNDVPAWVLIPHILAMMGALMLAIRAALEAMRREPQLRILTLRTLAALFVGGFPLGLLVSGYAFGVPWGGFPLGDDATDNKTLLAFAAWAIAAVAVFRGRNPRPWVLGAAAVMLFVYLVPHSFVMPR